MPSAYDGRAFPVYVRELQEVLWKAQIPDTCIAWLPKHIIWEPDSCWAASSRQ